MAWLRLSLSLQEIGLFLLKTSWVCQVLLESYYGKTGGLAVWGHLGFGLPVPPLTGRVSPSNTHTPSKLFGLSGPLFPSIWRENLDSDLEDLPSCMLWPNGTFLLTGKCWESAELASEPEPACLEWQADWPGQPELWAAWTYSHGLMKSAFLGFEIVCYSWLLFSFHFLFWTRMSVLFYACPMTEFWEQLTCFTRSQM